MAKKKPRRVIEALHEALQHHIAVKRALDEVHTALSGERDDFAITTALPAKSEHLALSARLFELLTHLDPRRNHRTGEWRVAQLRRVLRKEP
jgi:predicted trehalose synthase